MPWYVIHLMVDMKARSEKGARRVANAIQLAAEQMNDTRGIRRVRILEHRLQKSGSPRPVFVRKQK